MNSSKISVFGLGSNAASKLGPVRLFALDKIVAEFCIDICICTVGQKKKKCSSPANSNTNYRREMKLEVDNQHGLLSISILIP